MTPSCSMRRRVRLVLTMPALVIALTSCSRTESHSSSGGATASASPGAATSGASPSKSVPQRGHIDCAGYLSHAVETSKSLKVSMWAEPGSWGALNSALHQTPAGAELCGATHLGDPKKKPDNTTVFFRSALYGEDLKKFWDPIMAAGGCALSKNEIDHGQTKLVWRCPGDKGGVVTVLTDPMDEIYGVGHLNL